MPRSTTIDAMAEDRDSPVSAEELSLINGIEPDTMLARGDRIKWVVGELPPS